MEDSLDGRNDTTRKSNQARSQVPLSKQLAPVGHIRLGVGACPSGPLRPGRRCRPGIRPNDRARPGGTTGGINLPRAWDNSTGSASVAVAVIDTGRLPNHPDITGSPNLAPGYDMISDTFVANDGDGRDGDPTDPGDATAADECFPGSQPSDDSWHGTHVAGTVA